MKLRKYRLEDVCNLQIGKTPRREIKDYWGKGYSWVSISDMKSPIIDSTKEEITEMAVYECGCKLIPKGTILLSFKLSIGKLAYAGKDLFTNEAIVALGIKNSHILHQDYLYYVLKNIPLVGSNNAAMGSTLNKESLRILSLPIPEDISDQLHIATILSEAENLISQRKESLRLLDEFLQSTFLEMFGDPVSNKNEFSTVSFGDYIIKIIAGSSYGGEQKDTIQPDEYGVLKVSAVTWGVFNPKEFKIVNKKDIKGRVIHPLKGDLLFSRANTKELVGATCIVDTDYPKLFLPDKLWNIKLNESKLNKIFIHHLFKDKGFKNILTLHATGTSGSMLNISMEKLRNVKFAIPPIELQNRFAKIVEKIEALKIQYQQSLKELENLYGSLSQKAFRGELNFKEDELMIATEPELNYSKNEGSEL